MNEQHHAALESEHQELHVQLDRAIQAGGEVGAAATAVAELLHAHFVGEERYALPPLGLLPRLAAGEIEPEMAGEVALAETLKAELPQMLAEHRAIVAALGDLRAAAHRAQNEAALRFADQLERHAQNEEEILYPAAILVGEYLKLKLRLPVA
jgi:hypothetical protein